MKNKKILVVAAHPDDEILGCGGTMARLASLGNEVYTLILGEGVTSRDEQRDADKRQGEFSALQEQIREANGILGVKEIATFNFPDNRFDSVDLFDIIKAVERIKNKFKPDVIFTHFKNDLNVDHKITYDAVLTATRPIAGESVKEIYTFEVLSSTEWNYPLTFSPDTFYDINDYIDLKMRAMEAYKSELKDFPHPRSLKAIRFNAENWGYKTGLRYAEAFKTVRAIK